MARTPLLLLLLIVVAVVPSSEGQQISTACTSSLISSFTPCLNFVTGSSNGGGGSPTKDCCRSLASLVGSSAQCACLILTGAVPFSLPLNRTLAVTLPRLCQNQSVPLQCTTAVGTPLPSPGSISLAPSLPPLPPLAATPPAVPSSPSIPASESPRPISTTPADQGGNQEQRPFVLPSSALKISATSCSNIIFMSVLPISYLFCFYLF